MFSLSVTLKVRGKALVRRRSGARWSTPHDTDRRKASDPRQYHLGRLARYPVRFGLVGLVILLGSLPFVDAAGAEEMEIDRQLFARGLDVYNEHCAVCHGENGDGKGTLASGFTPRPRDLTLGTFKFKTSEQGDFPAREDFIDTIRRGIDGSYGRTMPAFDHLPPDDIYALTEVMRVASGAKGFGVRIVPPQQFEDVDLARGQELFRKMSCVDCHGENGDGRGTLAAELVDADGQSIQPADLRVGKFKGGSRPTDIWMRLYTGIEGTPMPGFGRSNSSEELWQLVNYVLMFSKDGS